MAGATRARPIANLGYLLTPHPQAAFTISAVAPRLGVRLGAITLLPKLFAIWLRFYASYSPDACMCRKLVSPHVRVYPPCVASITMLAWRTLYKGFGSPFLPDALVAA